MATRRKTPPTTDPSAPAAPRSLRPPRPRKAASTAGADPDAVAAYVPPPPPGFVPQVPEPATFADETVVGQYGHQHETVPGLIDTAMQPERLDPDLAGLDNPEHRRKLYEQLRVTPMVARAPDDVMLVWVGFHKGVRTETSIAINVPDTTNDDRAWELIQMVEAGHPAQRFTDHQTHKDDAGNWYPAGLPINNRGAAQGRVVTPDTFHVKGPTYHFDLGKSRPVSVQDARFLLEHPVVVIKVARDAHAAPASPGRALINDIKAMTHEERLEFFEQLGLVKQKA